MLQKVFVQKMSGACTSIGDAISQRAMWAHYLKALYVQFSPCIFQLLITIIGHIVFGVVRHVCCSGIWGQRSRTKNSKDSFGYFFLRGLGFVGVVWIGGSTLSIKLYRSIY